MRGVYLRPAWFVVAALLMLGAAIPTVLSTPVPLDQQPFPDSQEYADAAHQLALGRGYVTFAHQDEQPTAWDYRVGPQPPRYPPGTSLAILPFVWLGGPSYPTSIVWATKSIAIVLVLTAGVAGWVLGGPLAAVLAAWAVGTSPFAQTVGNVLLSDGIGAILGLLAMIAIARNRWLSAGVCLGCSVLIRLGGLTVLAAALFVGLFRSAKRSGLIFIGAAPGVLALAINQWIAFGSPLVSGYAYWLPGVRTFALEFGNRAVGGDGPWVVPDRLGGEFMRWACLECGQGGPLANLPNVVLYPATLLGVFWIFAPPAITGIGLVWCWANWRHAPERFALVCVALSLGFYVFYFYQGVRFMATPATLLAVCGAVATAKVGQKVGTRSQRQITRLASKRVTRSSSEPAVPPASAASPISTVNLSAIQSPASITEDRDAQTRPSHRRKAVVGRLAEMWPWILLGIVAVGLALRAWAVGAMPLFVDEDMFAQATQAVTETPLPGSLLQAVSVGSRPPLIFLLDASFSAAFAGPAMAGRVLSLVFATLTIGECFYLGSRVGGKGVGLLTSLLYAISPLSVLHERMAVQDGPITAVTLGAVLLLWKAADSQRPRRWAVAASLVGAMGVQLKPSAVLVCVAMLLLVWAFDVGWQARTQLAALAIAGPIVSHIALSIGPFSTSLLDETALLTPFQSFAPNLANFVDTVLTYMPGGAWLLVIAGAMFLAARRFRQAALFIVTIVTWTTPFVILSRFMPSRYSLPSLPYACCLIAIAVFGTYDLLRSYRVAAPLLGAIVVGLIGLWGGRSLAISREFLRAPLSKLDDWQYRSGWPSGYSYLQAMQYALQHNREDTQLAFLGINHHRYALDLDHALPPRFTIAGFFYDVAQVQWDDSKRLILIVDQALVTNVTTLPSLRPQLHETADFPRPGSELGVVVFENTPDSNNTPDGQSQQTATVPGSPESLPALSSTPKAREPDCRMQVASPEVASNVNQRASGPRISAHPSTLTLPSERSGQVRIDWDTGNNAVGEVWVSVDGGNGSEFAMAPKGEKVAPWIAPFHTYRFSLYDSLTKSLVASVDVVCSLSG